MWCSLHDAKGPFCHQSRTHRPGVLIFTRMLSVIVSVSYCQPVMSKVVVNEQAIMPMMFREPSLGTPQELLERVLRMPIFQGIEGFATEMIGEHHLCFWEMGYPEVRSGIAFAYCAKHGLDSAENFGRCVELFARAQAGVSYLLQEPCPFRASSWDPTPLRTLQLRAISVITRGYQIYGRLDRLSSFRDNKRPREVRTAVIDERELVEVASNCSRSSQQTPSPAPRPARSSSYLLRAFLDNITRSRTAIARCQMLPERLNKHQPLRPCTISARNIPPRTIKVTAKRRDLQLPASQDLR
jgi:hypothetical protein